MLDFYFSFGVNDAQQGAEPPLLSGIIMLCELDDNQLFLALYADARGTQ